MVNVTNEQGSLVAIWPPHGPWDIKTIAHALSRTQRWNGMHSFENLSVAEHSVRVSYMVPEEFAKAALFHDAAEAFIGDMVTPLKAMFPDFLQMENHILMELAKHFGFEFSHLSATCVVAADAAAAWFETLANPEWKNRSWMRAEPDKFSIWLKNYGHRICQEPRDMPASAAKELFLRRYKELFNV